MAITTFELIHAFAHEAAVAVVITDATVNPPGPVIQYANDAFAQLTGRALTDLIGIGPRFMQGRETRRAILNKFRLALLAGERFHGYLTNYRADGTKYLVEIDCRSLRTADGHIEHFVSFEREVVRRRGRPFAEGVSRYAPVHISNESLTTVFRNLNVFDVLPKKV